MQPFLTPLAVRCWPVEQEATVHKCKEKTPKNKEEERPSKGRFTWIGERVLVFDTETTIDEYQSLRFGFFLLLERGKVLAEGVFVADDLEQNAPEEARTIQDYAAKHSLLYMTRTEFADQIFFPEVWHLGTLCIGCNLPFDLSRIAVHAASGDGANRDAFSFHFTGDPYLPSVRIRSLSAHASRIEFLHPKRRVGNRFNWQDFDGRFLDVHTLAYALSGESYSLARAGVEFQTTRKKAKLSEAEDDLGHGRPVTAEYLDYSREDVWATFSLYLTLRDVYSKFPFVTCQVSAKMSH